MDLYMPPFWLVLFCLITHHFSRLIVFFCFFSNIVNSFDSQMVELMVTLS